MSASTPNFKKDDFVRVFKEDDLHQSGRLARYCEPRPNAQCLLRYLDPSNFTEGLAGRSGEELTTVDLADLCRYEVGHARLDQLVLVEENEARPDILVCLERYDSLNEAHAAKQQTADECRFKECPHCGHSYCGHEDCEDGSTPSGGDWSIKCKAEERCSGDCFFCDTIRTTNGSHGGHGVCCACHMPKGEWSYRWS